jgi:hypothetical protein
MRTQEVTKLSEWGCEQSADDIGRGGGGCVGSGMGRAVNLLMSERDDALCSGDHKEMLSILADQ